MINFARMQNAVRTARHNQKPFRDKRTEMIQQLAGHHYGKQGAPDRVPVNLIELTVNINKRDLAARRPIFNVTTPHWQLKPSAYELELAINFLLEQINFHSSIEHLVVDAHFGPGIMKVGVCGDNGFYYGGNLHMTGVPFADPVSLDDWVHDPRAKRKDFFTFCGNRYTVTRTKLLNYGLVDERDLRRMSPVYDDSTNEDGSTRASSISLATAPGEGEVVESYEFYDIWSPEDGRIYTLRLDGNDYERVTDWDGPKRGPYRMLGFGIVPDNVFPLAPGYGMLDLHLLANKLYRKLGRQAERQKTITAVQGGADEDGNRILEAADGQMIRVDNPERVKEIMFGGADQIGFAFAVHAVDRYSWTQGNLDGRGGLSPQADTLGQEKLLAAANSKLSQDMQDALTRFVQDVGTDLAELMWTERDFKLPLIKKSAGREQPFTYTPDRRQGDFLQYNFQIVPGSMQYVSPSQQIQVMDMAMQRAIAMGDMLTAQGQIIDTKAYFDNLADLSQTPAVREVVKYMGPDTMERMPVNPGGSSSGKPSDTKRTYERVNRSGATRQNKDQQLVADLIGKPRQPAERAVGMRAVG